MIKILQVRNIDSFVESRRQRTSEKDRKTVQAILNDVRKNGDSAVKKYERKFNGRKTSQLRVSEKEIKEALSKISWQDDEAIEGAEYLLATAEDEISAFLFSQFPLYMEEVADPQFPTKSFVPHTFKR